MKKILPLLVVGILVLSGLGAVTTPSKKSDADITASLSELEAVAKGGIGVTVIITNNGNIPIDNARNVSIHINGSIWIGDHWELPIPVPIPAGGGKVSVKTGLILALSWCTVHVSIDIDGDGNWDGDAQKNGFIILFFILVGSFSIPLS